MWHKISVDGRTVTINTDHIGALFDDDQTIVVQGIELVLSLAEFDNLHSKLFPTRKTVSKENVELAEFLNSLHKLCGGKAVAILTPQRERKLTALLKTFSQEQLTVAATNIGKDEWLQGKNDNKKRYGDIDYLLRPDKAAKFAELNPEDRKRKMF